MTARSLLGLGRASAGAVPNVPGLALGMGFLNLSLLTAVLGVLCYAASDQRLFIAVLTGLAALISWAMTSAEPAKRAPTLVINLLVLAAALNTLLSLATGQNVLSGQSGEGDLVTALTDFLAAIVLIKMLDRGRPRDEAQLLALSVFVVIGAVLTSNSLLLGLLAMGYVPAAVTSAVLLQVWSAAYAQRQRLAWAGGAPAAESATPERVAPALPRSGLRRTVIGIVAFVVASAVALFVLMPRTMSHQAVGGWGNLAGGARVDFTPQINLGQAGMLSISEEQVGEVVLRGAGGEELPPGGSVLYLRGAVLDEYVPASGQWRSSRRPEDGPEGAVFRPFGSGVVATTAGAGARVLLGDRFGEGTLPLEAGGVVQEITLRNAGPGRVPLLAIWRPREVRFEAQSRIEYDFERGLLALADTLRAGRTAYRVVSSPDDGLAGTTEPGEASEPAARASIAGPFTEGPIRDLAVQVLAAEGLPEDVSGADPGTLRRAARAIERYLRVNMSYSLEMIAPEAGQDPIEMFLFSTRRGHCEYFASAMTAMLRSVGVSARVVTGYAVAEFNGLSGHYVIRRADAHAWVEARTLAPEPGQRARWETFDPTPPGSLPVSLRAARASWLTELRQVWEALELTWIERVVAFEQTGASRRVDLIAAGLEARQRAAAARRAIDRAIRQVRDWLPGLGREGVLGVIALLAAAGLTGAWLGGRWAVRAVAGRLSRRRLGVADPHAPRFYTRLLASLRDAGLSKPETVPPLRHAQHLADQGVPERAVLLARSLAERYYAVRFGAAPLDREAERQTDAELAELATLLSKRSDSPPPPAR
jgi:hypothetical protein